MTDQSMDEGLRARAERAIDLGRRTGADGGGVARSNIYVIAAALLSALRQRDEALERWPCERCGGTGRVSIRRDTCGDCGGSGKSPIARAALTGSREHD